MVIKDLEAQRCLEEPGTATGACHDSAVASTREDSSIKPPRQGSDEEEPPVTSATDPCERLSRSPSPPHEIAALSFSKHLGASRQYWRDIILGVNDGLVSTFLLVAGVAGGGLSSTDILLTAIAGAIAGAVSMCAGEYVATKSQNEVMRGEIELEEYHVEHNLEEEMSELGQLLRLIGIPREPNENNEELHDAICEYYRDHPDALLKVMIALEFGVVEREVRSPVAAGLTSCSLFLLGAMPSVLPFVFSGAKPIMGLVAAAVVTTTGLLIVGAVKTWATRGNCLTASVENLVIAGCGGVLAYGIGTAFDMILHKQ